MSTTERTDGTEQAATMNGAFTLTIQASNAAFADEETGEVDVYSASREIARILRTAADEVAAGRLLDAINVPVGEGRWLRDENGNKVGSYALDEGGGR